MMHDESTDDPAEKAERTEATILCLLLDRTNQQPWAVEELVREIGRPLDVTNAVASLHAAGLIHHCGEFVFATRAAVRLDSIAL
jgi:HD-like signal output (HDOD) protein